MIELYEAYRLQFDILGQVAMAMLLGAGVGLDREMADKPAGLRTHILVAGAAALLVSLGDVMLDRFSLEGNQAFIQADPFRLVGWYEPAHAPAIFSHLRCWAYTSPRQIQCDFQQYMHEH